MLKLTAAIVIVTTLIFITGCEPVEVVVTQPTPTGGSAGGSVTPGATPLTDSTTITVTGTVTDTGIVTGTPTALGTPTIISTQTVTETGTAVGMPAATATQAVTGTAIATDTSVVTTAQTLTGTGTTVSGLVTIPTLPTDMTNMSIGQIISTTEGFETLATALQAANLLDVLDTPGPLTLFAPTDNAFAIYPADSITRLLANPAVLLDVLQYHLVVDSSPVAQLVELGGALTYMGELVDITVDADGAYQVNEAIILQTDIQAANGIIHVINGLLIPSSAESLLVARTVNPQAETDTGTRALTLEELAAADTSNQTILEVISSIDGFTTLAAAVDSAGLNDALSSGGPITLFAPTNGAFAEISDTELEALLNSQPAELVRTLQYHTILDGVTAADLAQLGSVLTATGDPITVTVNSDGVITLNGGATVFVANIEASNGVVHAISAVLSPPAQ